MKLLSVIVVIPRGPCFIPPAPCVRYNTDPNHTARWGFIPTSPDSFGWWRCSRPLFARWPCRALSLQRPGLCQGVWWPSVWQAGTSQSSITPFSPPAASTSVCRTGSGGRALYLLSLVATLTVSGQLFNSTFSPPFCRFTIRCCRDISAYTTYPSYHPHVCLKSSEVTLSWQRLQKIHQALAWRKSLCKMDI